MPDRTPTKRRDMSVPLFVDITTVSVDPAYVEASARAAARGEDRRRGGVVLVAGVAVIGLLLGVAAHQVRTRAPAARRVRAALVRETERRTAVAETLRRRQEELRAETAQIRDRALSTSATGRAITDRLHRLELAAAGLPVRGPGLVVRLADAPDGTQVGEDDGQVRDRDLQDVVNALWAAGAEAIAVNGQRISSLTAIRAAGEAILVDYQPLTPPYVVEAVGDADVMDPAFNDSVTAGRFRTWEQVFGLSFSVERRRAISLPGASTTQLRYAEAVP